MLGTGDKIFCYAAVNVTTTSQTSGTQVIHMYFAPCILKQNRGGDAQRDRGQQLIRDAEQRPQRIDAAQRIAHALIRK